MSKPLSPPDLADTLPQELLAGIGDVVVRWGRLEYQVHRLITVGFRLTNEASRALTIGMDLSAACGVLRTLAYNDHWVKSAPVREALKKLASDIRDASKSRNGYAHGVFGFDMGTPNSFARYLFKDAQHKVNPSSDPIDVARLRTDAAEAQALIDRAIELTVRMKALRSKS